MKLAASGMSGLPVANSAGFRPAVLCDHEAGRYTIDGKKWYSAVEAREMQDAAILVLADLGARSIEDGVVLYADESFLEDLDIPREMTRILRAGGHAYRVCYVPRARGRAILRNWGLSLLESASRSLAENEAAEALGRLRRARMCLPTDSHGDDRRRCYRAMAQACRAMGSSVDPVQTDCAIEFPHEAERICAERGSATPAKKCGECKKYRRYPGTGDPGWSQVQGRLVCPSCAKRCRRCDEVGLYDPCEECDSSYVCCAICGDWQPKDDLCRHLFWSEAEQEYLGSGSWPGEWDRCKASFMAVLKHSGLAKVIGRAMKAHRYYTHGMHAIGGLGPSYFTFSFCGRSAEPGKGRYRFGRSYADILLEGLTEEQVDKMADGIQWLMSLWSGPEWRPARYRPEKDSYSTRAADRRTLKWIDEFLGKEPRRKHATPAPQEPARNEPVALQRVDPPQEGSGRADVDL